MNKKIDKNNSDLLDALLRGDRKTCSQIIKKKLDSGIDIKKLYDNFIKPNLYEIGVLWEYNKISVATEHLASAIVEGILNEIYPTIISTEKNNYSVIVSCVENEFHQIGIKMVSDIFELNGWNSYYLGSNTPTNELIDFAKTIKPDILGISLSIYFHLPALETMIQKIRAEFPNLTILIGGQAFRRGGQDAILKYSNVIYLPDLEKIDMFIKNYK